VISDNSWLADVEVSIRRIAIAYRGVTIIWTGTLVLSAVMFNERVLRVWVLVAAWLVLLAWFVVVLRLYLARSDRLGHPLVLAVDTGLAAATMFVPWMAGNAVDLEFSAGYPLSAVVLAVAVTGVVGVAMAGSVLTVAALVRRFFVFQDATLGNVVSDVLIWVFPVLLIAWTARIIRTFARERLVAEEALAEARAEQARLQERQEVAAHLHDSVLQTLALIQRQPDDPAQVASLARTQERELRTWLFGDAGGGVDDVRSAVAAMCAEVEDHYRISVELVATGNAPLSPALEAMVRAAREAVVNAAKHADVGRIDVFLEVGGGRAEMFVRDRGSGYDPEAVSDDRRGVRDSIVARMERSGGRATVRTGPDRGTEVRLEMPIRQPSIEGAP
jgi:signal transduction histidine kinase